MLENLLTKEKFSVSWLDGQMRNFKLFLIVFQLLQKQLIFNENKDVMQYNPQILHVKYNCGDTIEIEIPTNVIKIHQQGIFSNHGGKNIKQKYLHFLLVITILMPTVIMTTPLLLLVLFTMCFACFRLKSQYIDKKSPSKMIPFMQIYLQLKFFKNSHSYSFSLEANSSTLLCGVLFFSSSPTFTKVCLKSSFIKLHQNSPYYC